MTESPLAGGGDSRITRTISCAAPAVPPRRLTTHSTGRAISKSFIENMPGFGGPRAPVNSGVMRLRLSKFKNTVIQIYYVD